ncbi:WD40 repeat domain-containing protein [Novipirellula herctigrandis]
MSKLNRERFILPLVGLVLSTLVALVGCVRSSDSPTNAVLPAVPEDHPRFLTWIDSRVTVPLVHAVSPNGRFAIAQTQTETIVYDLNNRKEIKHWPSGKSQWSFSQDSKRLLRLQADEISVLATNSLDMLARWKAKPKLPTSPQTYLQLKACISHDGSLVAVENRDGCFDAAVDSDFLILNVDTGFISHQIDFPFDRPETPRAFRWEFSFVGAYDRLLLTQRTFRLGETLRRSGLMQIDDAELICELPANGIVRYSKDQKLIAVGKCSGRSDTSPVPTSASSEIEMIDVRSGSRQRLIKFAGTLRDFDIDPRGKRLLASVQKPDASPPMEVDGFAADPGGRLTHLLQWNLRTGQLNREIDPPPMPVAAVRYGVDASSYMMAMERPDGVDDGLEQVWRLNDISTGKQLTQDDWLQRGTMGGQHQDFFLYPDGKHFIVRGGEVQVRALPDGKTLWRADDRRLAVHDVTFSPDGNFCWADGFLSRLNDGHQRRWGGFGKLKFMDRGESVFFQGNNEVGIVSLRTSTIQWRQSFSWNGSMLSADISPDTNSIAIVLEQNRYWTRELPTRKVVLIDRRSEDEPRSLDINAACVCFDPTGETILIATNDGIEQVNVETGAILQRIGPLPGDPLAIQISPGGKRLFVAGQSARNPNDFDRNVFRNVFRNVMGTGWLALVDLQQNRVQPLHQSETPITCIALSDDGNTLAAANGTSDTTDSQIWIWDAPTAPSSEPPRQRFSIDGHRLGINDLAFSPDACMLLSAADDGAALWDLRSELATQNGHHDTVELVFPKHTTTVEAADVYRGEVRRVPPYEGPLLFPESPESSGNLESSGNSETKAAERPKANWPLVLINHSSNEHHWPGYEFKESNMWLRNAKQRINVNYKVDWRSAESKFLRRYELGPRSEDWKWQFAFDDNERRPVLLDENHQIIQAYPKVFDSYQSTLSPSGKCVAIYSEKTRQGSRANNQLQIELLDATTAEKIWTSSAVAGIHVSGIEMDRGDQFVSVNDNGRAMIVFDGQSGKLLARYQPEYGSHLLTRLSPSGQFVATGQRSLAGVILRDPRTLEKVKTLDTQFCVNWLQWTPDGNHIIAGQSFGDGMELVQCWDVERGESQWTRRMPESQFISFDQAGDWMLTGSRANEKRRVLCDVSDGAIAAVFSISSGSPVERPVLSKSGGVVHLGSSSQRVVWPMQEQP